MDNFCPECGGVDHTSISECPHLTDREKRLWEKASKYGYKLGYNSGYEHGEMDGKQFIRDSS
jgi:hypothetical protein